MCDLPDQLFVGYGESDVQLHDARTGTIITSEPTSQQPHDTVAPNLQEHIVLSNYQQPRRAMLHPSAFQASAGALRPFTTHVIMYSPLSARRPRKSLQLHFAPRGTST